ncbi:YunC family protein [Thalassobacillus hwangdonensis]|uniref:YunC family protein n=1 Tax=Thalassobacillus hwangdonensis TaxID=546108 RepID=A0ABW3L623_9BACI
MFNVNPIKIEDKVFTAISVQLPKTNLLVVSNEIGYIMCGALDVDLLNEKLADRNIIAGRAVGVKTIEQLLEAPLEKVTLASEKKGWYPGLTGKEALLKIAEE